MHRPLGALAFTLVVLLLAPAARAESEISIIEPAAGAQLALGKKPIQIVGAVNKEAMEQSGICDSECVWRCVVVQRLAEGGGEKKWQGKPGKTLSCVFPAAEQSKFRAGPAQISFAWANSRLEPLMFSVLQGADVTFGGGGEATPRTPMQKFVARRTASFGASTATATSLGAKITYREFADRGRRWKPMSTALRTIKHGTDKAASWDGAYLEPWAEPESGGGLACPTSDLEDVKVVKVEKGALMFSLRVDGASSKRGAKIVRVKVPIGPRGAIRGTLAVPGVGDVTVTGVAANEDAVYKEDVVRYGRSVTVEVTPKSTPDEGCAFRAIAADFIESRPCIARGEAITSSAVVQTGFNSMERCCRGSRANDKKLVCE